MQSRVPCNIILCTVLVLSLVTKTCGDNLSSKVYNHTEFQNGVTGETQSGGRFSIKGIPGGAWSFELSPYMKVTLSGSVVRSAIISKSSNVIILNCATPGQTANGWNYSHLLVLQHDGNGWSAREYLTEATMKKKLGHSSWVRELIGIEPSTGNLIFDLSEIVPGNRGDVTVTRYLWKIGGEVIIKNTDN